MSWSEWSLAWWIALTAVVGVASATEQATSPPPAAVGRIPAPRPGAGPVVSADVVPLPVSVEAPSVGLRASLVPVGKTPEGALELPDFGTAGWYEQSARPGAPGSAVLAGHVDSFDGPDVFYALRSLEPGDRIDVRRGDGSVVTFVVDGREETSKDALPIERVFDSPSAPSLRLITCGGDFDRRTRSYRANVIVYATLVDVRS